MADRARTCRPAVSCFFARRDHFAVSDLHIGCRLDLVRGRDHRTFAPTEELRQHCFDCGGHGKPYQSDRGQRQFSSMGGFLRICSVSGSVWRMAHSQKKSPEHDRRRCLTGILFIRISGVYLCCHRAVYDTAVAGSYRRDDMEGVFEKKSAFCRCIVCRRACLRCVLEGDTEKSAYLDGRQLQWTGFRRGLFKTVGRNGTWPDLPECVFLFLGPDFVYHNDLPGKRYEHRMDMVTADRKYFVDRGYDRSVAAAESQDADGGMAKGVSDPSSGSITAGDQFCMLSLTGHGAFPDDLCILPGAGACGCSYRPADAGTRLLY